MAETTPRGRARLAGRAAAHAKTRAAADGAGEAGIGKTTSSKTSGGSRPPRPAHRRARPLLNGSPALKRHLPIRCIDHPRTGIPATRAAVDGSGADPHLQTRQWSEQSGVAQPGWKGKARRRNGWNGKPERSCTIWRDRTRGAVPRRPHWADASTVDLLNDRASCGTRPLLSTHRRPTALPRRQSARPRGR